MSERGLKMLAGVSVLALILGIAGLVIGLTAKDANDVSSSELRSEVREQVQSLQGELGQGKSELENVRADERRNRREGRRQSRKLNKARAEGGKLQAAQDAQDRKISSLESTTSSQSDDIKRLQTQVQDLQNKVNQLETKLKTKRNK